MSPSFVFQGLKKQSSLPPGCSASMWEGCLLVPSPAQFLRWLRRGLKRTTVGCIQVRRNIWGKIRNISGPYVCACVCVFVSCSAYTKSCIFTLSPFPTMHILKCALPHCLHQKLPSLRQSTIQVGWLCLGTCRLFLEPIHSILAFCAHSASSTFIFQWNVWKLSGILDRNWKMSCRKVLNIRQISSNR